MATSSTPSPRQPLTPRPQFSVHEKQRAVLESDARYRALAWGRRGGKNIAANVDLIEYARHPWTSPWGADDPENVVCWWVGPTYDQAKKYGFETFLSAIPDQWIDGDPKRTPPYEINLINGATVEFRTYDKPESLQGGGVDRFVIDEAAYMPRSLWDNDLEPMLMDNAGAVMFISKPLGRNWFHEMYQRGESDDFPDYAAFHATSADNPFIEDDPDDKRGTVPERVFRQEYLAEFLDESGGVFTDLDENLFTATYAYDGDTVDATGEPPYAHGWDLARHEDYTVGVVLDTHGDVVAFERIRETTWAQIQTFIEATHEEYPGPVAVDATRDNKLVADLEQTGLPVEPVRFSPTKKADLVESLGVALEQGELSAPDIPPLRHELELFEYDVTPAGNTRYHAPEGFHDDCVDALALAVDAWDDARRPIRRTTRSGSASRQSRQR